MKEIVRKFEYKGFIVEFEREEYGEANYTIYEPGVGGLTRHCKVLDHRLGDPTEYEIEKLKPLFDMRIRNRLIREIEWIEHERGVQVYVQR